MRRPGALLFSFLLLLIAVTALAGLPPTRTQMILREANDPADLRKRLKEYIRATGADDNLGSGEAYYFLASSFSRAAQPDSAIVYWRSAVRVRNSNADRVALVEALLERRSPGDVDSALAVIDPVLTEARVMHDNYSVPLQALHGWGKFLAGDVTAGKSELE